MIWAARGKSRSPGGDKAAGGKAARKLYWWAELVDKSLLSGLAGGERRETRGGEQSAIGCAVERAPVD